MPYADLLRLAGALAAPAFFLLIALAALGAPPVALICLLAAQTRRTQHPEAYGRRLLRMALTCALPSLVLVAAAVAVGVHRVPWLGDWLRATPLPPILASVTALAYCVTLIVFRASRPRYRHGREEGRITQAFSLTLLSLACLWLAMLLAHSLGMQIQAVLAAPASDGISVAPLQRPELDSLAPLFWTIFVAAVPMSMACAGALSLEYLLLRRDREPFGREAFAQSIKLAARISLRTTLVAAAFLPALWSRISTLPTDAEPATVLVFGCGVALILACLLWIIIARSTRPLTRPLAIHCALLLLWAALMLLLAAGLLCLYAG
jgi:hypothetical protein